MSEILRDDAPHTPSVKRPEDAPPADNIWVTFLEKAASSPYAQWGGIMLLPVLVFLRYPVDTLDADMWWHMALGKYYITHHTLVMDHSVFSWTPTDPTWIYNTCLGSIAIYLFYTLAGGFGLWLFQWLVFLGVFLAFYLFLRLLNRKLDVMSCAVIAAVGVASAVACRFYKPELFSVLLFAWMMLVYFYVKVTRRRSRFYFLPLIFLLWVNFHGAFVIGLVVLGILFVGEVLNRLIFPRASLAWEDLFHFGCAVFLSVAALLINPYGADYLISTYQGITSAQYLGLQNAYVLAWSSLWPYLKITDFTFFYGGLAAWILTVMIAMLGVVFIQAFRREKAADVALLLVSGVLYWEGMKTARMVYFFAIVFFFVFYYFVVCRLEVRFLPPKAALCASAVFLFLLTSMVYFDIRYRVGIENSWFGLGLENTAPREEAEFIKRNKIPGPLFNDDITGAYLTWALYPDYKVFIDSRSSPYRTGVFQDYMTLILNRQTKESIALFRKKYPFNTAIIHYRHMPLIQDFLATGGEWRLIFFHHKAAVLVHESVLPFISAKVLDGDVGPARFSKESNPEVLVNVFNFYVNLSPDAGRMIYAIYKKNVSCLFKFKAKHLQFMREMIEEREKLSP